MMRSVQGPVRPVCDARLERAVERGAARALARFVERVHFGVRLAGALVRALADHDAIVGHDAGADHRIGRRAPEPAARVLERPPHPAQVVARVGAVYHFSWNSASTYSCAENGIRSSMPSPTPT